MQFRNGFRITICAAAFACSQYAALADYGLPTPAEKYVVVLDSWELIHDKPETNECTKCSRTADDHSWRVECTFNHTKHTWPINQFWLADRLNSNVACAGDWVKMTNSYLTAKQKLAKANKLAIEVIALEKGGPLTAAGLWTLAIAPRYEKRPKVQAILKRATQAKDPKVTAEQFKLIGSR